MEVAASALAGVVRRVRRRLVPAALAALLLICAALAVIAGLLGSRVHAARQADARHQAILHAARQEAVYLTSLDYKTLDSDLKHIKAGATGEVQQTFEKQGKRMRTLLPKSKVVSNGQVQSAGIVSADQDSAKVLVVADSTVHNSSSKKGTLRHYRLWMALERSHGRWLVSKLGFSKPEFMG